MKTQWDFVSWLFWNWIRHIYTIDLHSSKTPKLFLLFSRLSHWSTILKFSSTETINTLDWRLIEQERATAAVSWWWCANISSRLSPFSSSSQFSWNVDLPRSKNPSHINVNMAESCEKIPPLKWPCVLQPLHIQSSTFDRNYLLGS